MNLKQPLILASASPRRRELLSTLGLDFEVQVPDVDETLLPGESAKQYVERLAKMKAEAVSATNSIVIAADTIVVRDDVILGKPKDAEDAQKMLKSLSGRSHEVITGVCVQNTVGCIVFSVGTIVAFRVLDEKEIVMYVKSGEPLDKAGAYAIQGNAASMVSSIEGSYTNVVGLPLSAIYKTLISFH